jgi:AcrR family transcriptional regulator|tara:strand:+ start:698 stop:1321 length:624 start_codon:yes stop_codon:yes gene_type:complete
MNNLQSTQKKGRPKTINLDKLVNVAMLNYWLDGPTNVSLNEICYKAKISKPGLYREFGGEDGLMKSVLLLYQSSVTQQILNLLKLEKSFDKTLDELIAFVTNNKSKENKPKGCLLAKFRQSRNKFGIKTQEQIDIIIKKRRLGFQLWIEQSKLKGEFEKSMSSKNAANYIDSQLDYAVSELANGEDNNNVKNTLALALSVFRKNHPQ